MKKKKVTIAVQLLFGLIILAAGFNKLFLFMPVPEQTPAGKQFIDFLYATGYLMYVVALVEFFLRRIVGTEPNGTTCAPDPGTGNNKYFALSDLPRTKGPAHGHFYLFLTDHTFLST